MVGAYCHRCSRFAAVYVNVDERERERERETENGRERARETERANEHTELGTMATSFNYKVR